MFYLNLNVNLNLKPQIAFRRTIFSGGREGRRGRLVTEADGRALNVSTQKHSLKFLRKAKPIINRADRVWKIVSDIFTDKYRIKS